MKPLIVDAMLEAVWRVWIFVVTGNAVSTTAIKSLISGIAGDRG